MPAMDAVAGTVYRLGKARRRKKEKSNKEKEKKDVKKKVQVYKRSSRKVLLCACVLVQERPTRANTLAKEVCIRVNSFLRV